MSPAGTAILAFVRRARSALRRDGLAAVVGLGVGVVAAGLVVAWLAAASAAWAAPSVAPASLLAAIVVLVVVLTVWGLRRWVAAVDDRAVAAAVEVARSWPEGRLRGLLELAGAVPPNTSRALMLQAEEGLARELDRPASGVGTGALGERAARRRTRLLALAAVSTLLVVLLGWSAPARARAAWAPLLRPVAHLTPPPMPPLRVRPGDARVPRGELLPVEVEAGSRQRVTLHWRATGEVPGRRGIELDRGRAVAALGPVEAATVYWVAAPDGARSDTFRVVPVDPLLLRSLSVRVTYPAYLGRSADTFDGEVPPLLLPEGSTLMVRGSATRVLGRGRLVGADTVELTLSGDAFAVAWTPRRTGSYAWRLADADGQPAGQAPPPLEITVVPDAPPAVDVVFPGTDTVLPVSMRQPVTADARDDHGVAAAELVSWRVSAMGGGDPPVTRPLRLEASRQRVLLSDVLDATDRRMLPGDTLRYFIRVTDTTPAGQSAVSRTYALRLPDLAEMRERTVDDAEALLSGAETAAEQARRMESELRDLSRSSARQNERASRGGEAQGRMPFDAAQQARQALEEQERMMERVDSLRQRAEALQEAIQDAGLQDAELQRRLAELAELYDELASGELREELDRLRDALERMDPASVQQALEALASRQQEFRQRLEQSLELMRRAAAEHQMNVLARSAEAMAEQEEALSRDLAERADATGPGAGAARQEAMADRARELAQTMDQLQQRLDELGEEAASASTDTAGARTESAEEGMRQASSSVAASRPEEASRQGQEASRQLASAAERLDAGREAMASSWRQEVQTAMQSATRDALDMARQQEGLRQRMEDARQRGGATSSEIQGMQAEQAALRQGMEQLARNLADAANRSAMVGREVGAAAGRAMNRMDAAQAGLEDAAGRRDLPSDQAGEGVDALNDLALSLMRNADRVAASESGTGVQQTLEELAELAREQSALNGRAGALAPMQLGPGTLAQQLQELAGAQRAIAERLQGMEPGQATLGDLDAMAREADRLAQELAGSRLTPEVLRRQERLFHRLLDAGRSLERDEPSERRRAERPGAIAPAGVRPLDPRLQDTGLRFPPPGAAVLRALPPAYRLLILQYFDRLNRSGAGAPSPSADTPPSGDPPPAEGGGRP